MFTFLCILIFKYTNETNQPRRPGGGRETEEKKRPTTGWEEKDWGGKPKEPIDWGENRKKPDGDWEGRIGGNRNTSQWGKW